jgi:hypothetical protein
MPNNLTLRQLGGVGIVSDLHPYDLPTAALSAGVNIRFDHGKISRAPVARRVYEFAGPEVSHTPGFMFSIPAIASGAEQLVTVDATFSHIYSLVGSTLTDVTHAAAVSNDTGEPFTNAFLGNISYLNRRSVVPLSLSIADSIFQPLANWDSTWRCGVLRGYKDFLVALNLLKGADEFPAMVKWSDAVLYGSVPGSWDAGDPTVLAGENTLTDMRGPILDGLQLQDSFIIYGENEVWAMNYVGGTFVFDFRKRFDDVGILNTNCCVEVDGQHYVFDTFDLYKHDGTTKASIAHDRVKDFVFGGLIKDLRHLAFVAHNPKLNEVLFCYPSNDRFTAYIPSTGCNRAAVYNYRNDTWTYYDLPNVTAYTLATLTSGATWTSEGAVAWSDMGGAWRSAEDGEDRHTVFSSISYATASLTANRLYGLDLIDGGRLTKPIELEALKDAYGERTGIDLDENGTPIRSYKCLLNVYPQLSLSDDGTNILFAFGANDTTGSDPAWDPYKSFDHATMDKLDSRVAGRYLGWRFLLTGPGDFGFSGMDATVSIRGQRG